jgi:hypothetical protein
MKPRQLGILLVLPVLALFLGACPFSPQKDKNKKEDPPKYFPQSSPAYCLFNLRQAYVDRDIEKYLVLFTDDFTFVFNPTDVGNPTNPTPAQWGMAEEREATEGLFSSDLVDRILLTFDQDPATDSGNEYPGTWKVLMRRIRLQVDTRKDDGSQLTLLAEGSDATFYFKEFPSELASDGKPLWRIWRWEDQAIESGALAQAAQ